jgi:pimeloyl-ACP methyl ester carboxylesterase
MTKSLVVFSHGKESGPWGSKIEALAGTARARGCDVLSIDYRDLTDPEQRVERLLAQALPPHEALVLVGSSMGGYVSVVASARLRPRGIFLMAPAVYLPGYHHQDPVPVADRVAVVFGWRDEVVPVDNGIAFARRHAAALHVLDSDHRLNDSIGEITLLFGQFLDGCAGKSACAEENVQGARFPQR